MSWDAFLDTARRLVAGATEGDWRSAISRAYYAVFHFFRDWFSRQGISMDKQNAHFRMPGALTATQDVALQVISRRIADLREIRQKADYDLVKKRVAQAEAVAAVAEAAQIVTDFRAIQITPELIAKMAAWVATVRG